MSEYDAIKLERLWKLYQAAKQLKFAAYPAHGSGLVLQVIGGNVNDLKAAINSVQELDE